MKTPILVLSFFAIFLVSCSVRNLTESASLFDNEEEMPSGEFVESQSISTKIPLPRLPTPTPGPPIIVEIPKNPTPPRIPDYSASIPFDGIAPIYDPQFVNGIDADLHPDELVIGIAMEGEAKAYPVTVLRFREMVNDELAGLPILVTW